MAKSRALALQAGVAAAAVLAAGGLAGAAAVTRGGDVGWAYNGGQGQDHYSPLAQITKSNVGGLKPVWSFPLEPGALQGQPLVLGRTLYATTPTQRLLALDAVTGANPRPYELERRQVHPPGFLEPEHDLPDRSVHRQAR